MKHFACLVAASVGTALFFACTTQSQRPARSAQADQTGIVSEKQGSITLLKYSQTPTTNPAVSDANLAKLVAGNTAFAVDIYKTLAERSGNIAFSPYSISAALGMTWAGARGQTEEEMARTLHFSLPQDSLHAGLFALDTLLKERAWSCGIDLRIVNQLWGDRMTAFRPSFVKRMGDSYGAGMRVMDFAQSPDPSRLTINDWVRQHTNDRIQNLIPPGGITDLTRLVLTNAIYFKAKWANTFDAARTRRDLFYSRPQYRPSLGAKDRFGRYGQAHFMSQMAIFAAARTSDWQAVVLPYTGDQMSMLVMMPRPGRPDSAENALSAASIGEILNQLRRQEIQLRLPKFKFTTTSISLRSALMALGMRLPFEPGADFSGMAEKEDLFIDDVIHKAFVAVDEKETEAAAATAVMGAAGGIGSEPVPVYTFDHPFIFLIRDDLTGTVLFMGRVSNPTVEG